MEPSDPLLFYRNLMSRYTVVGCVGPVARTEYVCNEFWDGGLALDVYVVKGCDDSIDVEPGTVNEMLGYEESFWLQGLWRVADDHPVDKLLRRSEI